MTSGGPDQALQSYFTGRDIPEFARAAVFGATLCALRKKDSGLRPIAVGSFYRRLAGRIAAHHAAGQLSAALEPIQLGVGTARGCEVAVHSVREYLKCGASNCDGNILVKIDVKNGSIACIGVFSCSSCKRGALKKCMLCLGKLTTLQPLCLSGAAQSCLPTKFSKVTQWDHWLLPWESITVLD